MPELFLQYPEVTKWKIDFNYYTTSFLGGTGLAQSSIIIGLNQVPNGGTCSIDPQVGITENTIFTINCFNFTDVDGYITKFEYYCKILFHT